MICAIHQPNFLPWPRYMAKMALADVFILLDTADYSRGGWVNRTKIAGGRWLTVPVDRRTIGAPILDVTIADGWKRAKAANALRAAYGELPEELARLLNDPTRWLCDWNIAILQWLRWSLRVRTPMMLASQRGVNAAGVQRLADLCQSVGADQYLSGPSLDKYGGREPFVKAGIAVQMLTDYDVAEALPYPTRSELSCVDMLARMGWEAPE